MLISLLKLIYALNFSERLLALFYFKLSMFNKRR